MSLILKDVSFTLPLHNILYDEVLLHMASQGQPENTLRLWESPVTFVVLGRAGNMGEDLKMGQVHQDAVPVLMRRSGGGAVVQGKGCLNYALILSKRQRPEMQDLHRSFRFILEPLAEALTSRGIRVTFQPLSDLALTDSLKKFSGNAQHRGREFILQHGTILYDFDLDLAEKYLTVPSRVPAYRQGRSHLDFMGNLPLSRFEIDQVIKSCFGVTQTQSMTNAEKYLLDLFVDKYSGLVLCHDLPEKKKGLCFKDVGQAP